MTNLRNLTVLVALTMLVDCKHGEPPTYSGDADASVNAAATFEALAGIVDAGASDSRVTDASADDSADAGDPGLLPQTNDKPDSSAPEFSARMQLLWSAILHDDADLAIPAFFPLTAYEQTKAIS
ncbi:MAG: hypothetical protein ABI183_07620, partial [Polyangiaceae bacterium]